MKLHAVHLRDAPSGLTTFYASTAYTLATITTPFTGVRVSGGPLKQRVLDIPDANIVALEYAHEEGGKKK